MRRWPAVVLLSLTLALAACSSSGGGKAFTHQASTPAAQKVAVNATRFCSDYSAATTAYLQTQGDVTDPAFGQFLTLLAQAKAEAPPAIHQQVSAMYAEALRVRQTNGSGDLTAYSQAISDWATSHCNGPAASTAPSAAGASSGASGGPATFCAAARLLLQNLATLNAQGVEGTTSAAQWQQAAAAMRALVALAPTTQVGPATVHQDAETVQTDLDDIVSNGFDNSNGGANLQQDVGVLGGDADRIGCPQN